MHIPSINTNVSISRRKIKFFFHIGVTFFIFYFLNKYIISHEHIADVTLTFYNLTLPLISAFLILYRIKALPILGIFFLSSLFLYPLSAIITLSSQILAALISQLMYYRCTGNRGAVSFGRSRLAARRIGWLTCFNSVLFILLNHWLQFWFCAVSTAEFFSDQTLLSLQWLMNSCITGIPFCYLLLRIINNPKWGLLYLKKIQAVIETGPRPAYQLIWWLLLFISISILISNNNSNSLFTDYSLLFLLPIMLWGATYIGYILVAPVWVIILILLSLYIDDYTRIQYIVSAESYQHRLTLYSAFFLVYSLTIIITGLLSDRTRNDFRHLTRLYRSEPNTGLLNSHALSMDIRMYSAKALCHIRCSELEELEKIYGSEFRFEFSKALGLYIAELLHCHDRIYYTPGQGLMLRLDTLPDITTFYRKINDFRFKWEKSILGISCGIAYTTEEKIINNPSETIKQLKINSYISLCQGRPLSINEFTHGDNITHSGVIRDILQKGIDRQSFLLMAQPIIATVKTPPSEISNREKNRYHEILTRLETEDGKLIFPDTFLPVARRSGLFPALDITVIEQTLRFIHSRRESDPDCIFSINLTPESMNRIDFLDNVLSLSRKYNTPLSCIIFEIIESEILDNENVLKIIKNIRAAGAKIAIDDFGTGSSSYERLRNLDADILKIDGSFIKNITNDQFSYCAVKAFCEIAKLKKMQIVAEFVENEEIAKMLSEMGVDWLQGYYIGKPVPIELAEL